MRHPRGTRSILAALALLLSCAAVLWTSPSQTAFADSSGIRFTPSTGAVGTPVHVTIQPGGSAGPAEANYILGTTTTSPTGPACADSQPIPGLAPVTVGPNGGQVDFNWPDALNGGPYWLCASPADGASSGLPSYRSFTPFTVLSPGAPTPTLTPAADPTASISIPAGGIQPGATLTVQVSNWHSRSGTPPDSVALDKYDPTGAGDAYSNLQFAITSQDGAGQYTLSVTLPSLLPPQAYWIRVQDAATAVHTRPFTIAATPTPVARASRPASGDAAGQFPTSAAIIAALVALLVLLVGGFSLRLLRRR